MKEELKMKMGMKVEMESRMKMRGQLPKPALSGVEGAVLPGAARKPLHQHHHSQRTKSPPSTQLRTK